MQWRSVKQEASMVAQYNDQIERLVRSYGWLSARKGTKMGLFGVLVDVVSMPLRVAVDVVKLPIQLMDGDDLFQNTSKGLEKIEEDLDD